jgi:transcriptional regulator GlxA family with amidase domain
MRRDAWRWSRPRWRSWRAPRLQLAAEQLATGSRKVVAVGAEVGYESEAAFSRAFKRRTGYAPAAWRRMRQGRQS